MKLRHKKYAVIACSAIGVFPLLARAQLVDLGEVTAHAINNNGQVALDQGVYSNGVITPLPALPGGSTPAVPLAINASGSVAGYADTQITRYPVAYVEGILTSFASTVFTSGVMAEFNSGTGTGIN